jgi:hypothetical protein
MCPIPTDDPYGVKRLENSQAKTPAGIKRLFNQVAREWGLGALTDAEDSEQRRRYPKSKNFCVTEALNSLLAEYGLSQFCWSQ